MGGFLETLFLIIAIIVYLLQYLRKEKEQGLPPQELPLPRPKKSPVAKPKPKETLPKATVPEKAEAEPVPTKIPSLNEKPEEVPFFSKFDHFSEEEKFVVYSEILKRKEY